MIIFLGLISLIFILGLTAVIAFVVYDRSFDSCTDITQIATQKRLKASIKIAVIGDSWVTDKKLDQAISDTMLKNGTKAEVVSSGQPGAVSRQVYRNLTSDESTPYSCKRFLRDKQIDFIVVVAGINDTVEHIGHNYYAHHMLCIIKTIQAKGIYPIVVEIPEYGIAITPPKSFQNYAKRFVYRMLFDKGKHDVILDYRKAPLAGLTPDIRNNMTIVEYAPLSCNYNDTLDLYENPNHLNEKGYHKLGQTIAETIIKAHGEIGQKTEPNIR